LSHANHLVPLTDLDQSSNTNLRLDLDHLVSVHPISVWVACRGRAVTTTSAEEYELKANIHKYYRTNKVHC
jgi:hypothetical protein